MSTTADHNSTPGVIASISQMDDADFAKEFGLDIGGETDTETVETATEVEPEAEAEPEEVEADEETEAESEDDAEAESESEEADEPETAPEKPKPLTPFEVRDAEGKEVEAPEIRLTFKAGRKMQEDVPLDQVVRWAQSGFYAEQAVAERDAVKQELPKVQNRLDEIMVALEDQKALNAKLLEDEDFFLRARDQYAQVNTPEHRAARAEQRAQSLEQEKQAARLSNEAATFLTREINPKFAELMEEYPSVSEAELFGRLSIETSHLLRNGVIPRDKWPEVTRLLDTSIAQYAEAQHARRDGDRVKSQKRATQQVTKAKEEATKAKKVIAKALTPAPRNAGGGKTPKPIKTVDDAVSSVMDDVLAGIIG